MARSEAFETHAGRCTTFHTADALVVVQARNDKGRS